MVVLGPGVTLLWLYFGLTPPQPLPPWSIALFLGLIALAFTISALLIAGFVARLAAALRTRDREVARLREKALRDEQILIPGIFDTRVSTGRLIWLIDQFQTPLDTLDALDEVI